MHDGYVTWCDGCSWNFSAPEASTLPSSSRLDRLYAAAGRRLGTRLAAELAAADRLEPRLTAAKALAYAIAVGVYALALVLAGAGLALVVIDFPNPFLLVFGLVLVGAAVLMRPRLGSPPSEDVVSREDAPALYGLADEIAQSLGTPTVDRIQIVPEYNASWAVLGLRRRRVLSVGLPLLAMLEPQERVALVAHELAHARNGDATRGLLVGSAVRGLAELCWLIGPSEFERDEGDLASRAVNVVFYVVSRPVWWLLLLELHLLLRDSQRAEYLADALAARVAGTDAAASLQEKMLLEPTFRAAVQRASRAGGDGPDLFDDLAASTASVPGRERERRRRVARLEETRLGDTHPPTAKRLDLLERRPRLEPAVVLARERSHAVDHELRGLRAGLERRLVEDYRDMLYA